MKVFVALVKVIVEFYESYRSACESYRSLCESFCREWCIRLKQPLETVRKRPYVVSYSENFIAFNLGTIPLI